MTGFVTADIDMTGYNRGAEALLRSVGVTSRVFVEKETGELIKTLVKVSPPKDPARSRFHAETDVRSRFAMAANGGFRNFEETTGTGSGVRWYAVDESFLRGALPENDMTKESVENLYKTFRKYNKRGRINTSFNPPRKRQRVLISQKLLATKGQITKIASRVKKSFGRLKAAWMVATIGGAIKLSGGNKPPKWVTDHLSLQSRGRFENGLSVPHNASFTIANFAKGIGGKDVNRLAALAVSIRAKAMLKNAELYTSGKKNLSDYAR